MGYIGGLRTLIPAILIPAVIGCTFILATFSRVQLNPVSLLFAGKPNYSWFVSPNKTNTSALQSRPSFPLHVVALPTVVQPSLSPYVGRTSQLWQGPQELLKRQWDFSQARGASTKKLAYFKDGFWGFANTANGILTGALYAAITDRKFVFVSKYNDLFDAGSQGWKFHSAMLKDYTGASQAPKHRVVKCSRDDSPMALAIANQSGAEIPAWGNSSVRVSTNCPLFKFLAQKPSLQSKLVEMGLVNPSSELPAWFQVGHQLVRLLLQPSADLRSKVQDVFESGNMSHFAIVGIQIRKGGKQIGDFLTFGPNNISDATRAMHFVHCALRVGETVRQGRLVKFYLSTDNNDMRKVVTEQLGQDLIQVPGSVRHTRFRISGDAVHRALLDSVYMGMYADAVVVTEGSTFGMLAAMASGRMPYYVEYSTNTTTENDVQCVQKLL